MRYFFQKRLLAPFEVVYVITLIIVKEQANVYKTSVKNSKNSIKIITEI